MRTKSRLSSSRRVPARWSRLTIVDRCTCTNRSGSSCAASSVIVVRIRCSRARRPDAGVLVVGVEEEHVGDVDLVRDLALAGANVAQAARVRGAASELAQDGGQARVARHRHRRARRRPARPRAVASSRCRRSTVRARRSALHRLQHVVERLLLERGDRELVVGGDEDDARPPFDSLRHLEAGQARHLDVEEGEVGLERGDPLGRLDAVAGDGDDRRAPARPSSAARAGRRRGAARRRR